MIDELHWWIHEAYSFNGNHIQPPPVDDILTTDASEMGWGAHLRNFQTNSVWLPCEQANHIIFLELLAVFKALKNLCSKFRDIHICIQSDNSVAIAYINNMGGAIDSLHELSKCIWLWCYKKSIYLSAKHIQGKFNLEADFLSRNFSNSTEWMLHENTFNKICNYFGTPDIDLFASSLNYQIESYVSWYPDPYCLACDAFTISWNNYYPYIFAPFSLIPRILNKLVLDKIAMAIMVVPAWSTQVWYPLLLSLLVDYPLLLPKRRDLLRLVHSGALHPLKGNSLRLTVCLVSGQTFRVEAFQKSLQNSSLIHGDQKQTSNINWLGIDGIFGVCKGKSIPYFHL
ncbi:hypothetical protein SNE40_018919 [Patella caerulea]|uniref:RNase H type-1 domain-containing protein n=1 Tax=Patella caerulea TaxID=87958 RepID=A0AAN8P9C2_PATCE